MKHVYCRTCRQNNKHYEEKETDVAISVTLLELLFQDAADIIVLVTGDTDLAPAVRTAQRLFPTKELCLRIPLQAAEFGAPKVGAKTLQNQGKGVREASAAESRRAV